MPGSRYDVFIRDLQSEKTERVSVASDGPQARGDSYLPVISADGRLVAFLSHSNNLVEGDTNNAGVYTVTLLVSGPGGTNTIVRPAYINVQPRRFFLPLVRR